MSDSAPLPIFKLCTVQKAGQAWTQESILHCWCTDTNFPCELHGLLLALALAPLHRHTAGSHFRREVRADHGTSLNTKQGRLDT